jgi:hypothetical protein
MARKKKEASWLHSEAKNLLLKDLRSGDIPLDSTSMTPQDVFLQRPEFADFGDYDKFPGRLSRARKYVVEHNSRAASDSAAFAHDSKIYPRPAFNHRGEPRWPGSVAEKLLCQDMDEGKHNRMTPKALHESRNEFHEKYPLAVFRQHIYQETKRRKFLAQYGSRNNQNNNA